MAQSEEAIGKEEFKWMTSGAVICNVVCSMLCGSKAIVRCFEIDAGKGERTRANKRTNEARENNKRVAKRRVLCLFAERPFSNTPLGPPEV